MPRASRLSSLATALLLHASAAVAQADLVYRHGFEDATELVAALPLGTFVPGGGVVTNCPAGFQCSAFAVSCSGVTNNANGFLAVRNTTATFRGVLVFFTGGSGGSWWTGQGGDVAAFAEELRALGFTIAQVRWGTNWLESSPGNDAGTAHLGCRPATVIKHLHDTLYAGGSRSETGRCGFCISGNSGGASQVSYALSHYGLDTILDAVVPTGGPPHADLAKACLDPASGYALDTRNFLDRGFGYFAGNGPCATRDASFTPRWTAESIGTGGSDYDHPPTRVHIVIGDQDVGMQRIAATYIDRLRATGTPLTYTIAVNTPHGVFSTQAGRAAIEAAILDEMP
ncbi:MAG TPA: hypothetical protein VND91_11700 [Candidatus Saccharimonadia bacterium]|nr:hypothetical protein [Candidatus Saccharimonadia bacterium]